MAADMLDKACCKTKNRSSKHGSLEIECVKKKREREVNSMDGLMMMRTSGGVGLCILSYYFVLKLISQLGSHDSLTPKRCMSAFCFYVLLHYGMFNTGKERALHTEVFMLNI